MAILLFLIIASFLALTVAFLYLLFGFFVWMAASADEPAPMQIILFWLPIMLNLDNG